MAQHTVTHTCGHDQTHQLYGPGKDRERKLDWLGTTLCTDCWKAEQDAARTAGNASAAAANSALGLPTLTGSEKQIAWAESIRQPVCSSLRTLETRLQLDDLSPAAQDEMAGAFALVIDEIVGRTESRWWIDCGQDLSITDVGTALYYVSGQIKERGLAPTAFVEMAALKARKAADKQAQKDAETILVRSLSDSIREELMTWDHATNTTTAAVNGHTITCVGSVYYATVTVDGRKIQDPSGLREKLTGFRERQSRERSRAERQARSDSFAAASVSGVVKVKQSITVTLSDGRKLTGTSSREGWTLTAAGSGYNMPSVDPEHPEIVRLASEAKAAHKASGKVGA